jgi:predicted permease
MKSGGRGIAGADRRHRIGKALVVGQVALSLVLVAAAGLLVGSFRRLVTLDPGFRRDGVLLAAMDLGGTGLKDRQLVTVPSEILRQIRAVPGVTSASMSMVTPVGHSGWNDFVRAQGFNPTSFQDSLAWFNHVSEGYFTTLGTELLAGRDITAEDVAQSRSVAVIDQTMARRVFGMDRPIGRTFQTPVGDTASPPREVIGVVRDAKYQRLDEKPRAMAYFPYGVGTNAGNWANFEIRTARPTASVVRDVERIAAGQSPAIALEFTTLSIQVSESLTRPRVLAALSGFFGGLALLLAVIGLYGTMSYSVTQRRNEIGIRMALGAGSRRVLGGVIGEALRLVALGVVVGTVLALASTRLIASFLYGVAPKDPTTLAISAGVLALIAMASAAAPAWRASRLDPVSALRED